MCQAFQQLTCPPFYKVKMEKSKRLISLRFLRVLFTLGDTAYGLSNVSQGVFL